MDTFGDRLRRARESRGVSLPDIATATKISAGVLEALERNDVRRLPGGIFGRAIVRAYAAAVGLDPDVTVNEFQSEIVRAERERARTIRQPEITSDDRQFLERQRRALRLVRVASIALIVVSAALVAWWFWPIRPGAAPADTPSATPLATPLTTPSALPTPTPSETPAPTSTPTPTTTAALVVEFEVSESCWLRVVADDGVAFDGVAAPGLRQRVPAGRSIQVQVGNAGVFRWWINGQEAKSLGGSGSAKRATVTPDTVAKFLQ